MIVNERKRRAMRRLFPNPKKLPMAKDLKWLAAHLEERLCPVLFAVMALVDLCQYHYFVTS